LKAAKLRFRPILMTSFAFILGVTPLLRAYGAGAEARKVMGMAVFAGMITATVIGCILIPSFFVLIERKKKKKRQASRRCLCFHLHMMIKINNHMRKSHHI
jgi:hydrophobic/amphiphilic exporter-1 (mainly G- bacteria), HAE1 family